MAKTGVVVVLVTYGARWHVLLPVLRGILAQSRPPLGVIVVDNGAAYDVAQAVREAELADQVQVSKNPGNLGSAGGFHRGLVDALASEAEFVWLLDDDNLPEHESLERLQLAYQLLGSDSNNALLSLRLDRLEFVAAAQGWGHEGVIRNSFLGFHPLAVLRKRLRRWLTRRPSPAPLVQVGLAPYGGWFAHVDLIARLGLPISEYYLYVDDHEYTSRVADHGAATYLCASSQIKDIDHSHEAVKLRAKPAFSSAIPDRRIFYAIRNRIHFEQRFIDQKWCYWLNGACFFLMAGTHALLVERKPQHWWRRMRLLRQAIGDGLAGRLGLNDAYRF